MMIIYNIIKSVLYSRVYLKKKTHKSVTNETLPQFSSWVLGQRFRPFIVSSLLAK